MKNTELIKVARIIADSIHVHSSFQDWEAAEKDTLEKCADALEAAEKRIDGLQKLVDINTERCEALRKQLRESHESYEQRIAELEAQLPKRGEWIGIEYDGYADGYPVYDVWECSECGEEHNGEEDTLPNYCPNCGADMRGDKR